MNPRRAGTTLALLLLGALLLVSLRGVSGRRDKGESFRYDLSAFTSPDPALVGYEESATVPLGAGELGGLCVDGEGRVHVTAAARLLTFDPAGKLLGSREISGTPGSCAAGTEGEIYLAMGDRVATLLPDGRLLTWTSLGEKALITSLAAGRGNLFAADAGSRQVWRFDLEGRLLGSFGRRDLARGELGFIVPSPYFDLALGPGDRLWVANPGRLRVERYSPGGELEAFWGIASLSIEGFGGCCNPSHIALLGDGSLVTSEKGIPRVKVYSPGGELRSVVAPPSAFGPGTVDLDLAAGPGGTIYVLDIMRKALRLFVPAAGAAEDA